MPNQVEAVIFDWGGTLTPWHHVDLRERWLVYATTYDPSRAEALADALADEEVARWGQMFETSGESGSGALEHMLTVHGVDVHSDEHHRALALYLAAWEPNTHTDPDAAPLLKGLRSQGIATAVLSNTMWPRAHHEYVLARDGVLDLFDYLLFTSETANAKPHRSVFSQVANNLGVPEAHCAFVGDRLFDDILGSQRAGMKGIWIPHSNLPPAQSTDLDVQPDATATRLGDVLQIVQAWNAA